MIRPLTILIAAALLFGPLLAAELGTRALIDSGRLPEAPSSNEETDVSLANLRRLGKPDVLIMGTSAARAGIKPGTLEELIGAETGEGVHVQGVAQAGMSLESQRLLVQQLAANDLLPEVVITALTPVSLGGDHGGDEDWFRDSELGQLWGGCAGDLDGAERFDCQLSQVSALWRWRGRPDRIVKAVDEGMPRSVVQGERILHEDGWLDTPGATPKHLRAATATALERVEKRIDVPDDIVDDFAALIEELRSHGSTVVVAEIPYSAVLEASLVARNPRWREQRDKGFARLEAAAGIDFVDVDGFGDWIKPSSFRDPRHLSGKGAGPFTRQLWEMLEFREPLLKALASAD